jgi:outer membrane protein assembly factor BamB
MNQYDNDFAPESVDEQVEQLLSEDRRQADKVIPQARMVHDLQNIYKEEEVLAHVWNGLVEHMENKNARMLQAVQNEQPGQTQIANFERRHSIKPVNQSRYSRLSLVAAVLMAALVVGSMVWVLTFLQHQDTHVATPQSPNASPSGIYIGAGNGVFRIDRQTHKVVWRYKFPVPSLETCGVAGNCALFAGNLLLAKNMLYVPLQGGILYALDANNGKLRWSHNFNMFLSGITLVDGQLCAVSSEGSDLPDFDVHMFNPANGGEYKHYHFSRNTGGSFFSVSIERVVAGQILYANSDNRLYAFNLANGKQIWQQQIDQRLAFSGLQVVNGVLYASSFPNTGTSSSYVYAFNASTGAPLWQSVTVNNAFLATVSDNVVYVSAEDPNSTTTSYMLSAYNAQTGKKLWHSSVGISASASNTVVDAGIMYMAGGYGENNAYQGVIALNTRDGSVKWQTPDNAKSSNSSNPASGPVLVDGTIYVGDTSLHALNARDGSSLWNLTISGLDVTPVIVTIVVAP